MELQRGAYNSEEIAASLMFECAGFDARIIASESVHIARSSDGLVLLIFHGEIYNIDSTRQAAAALDLYIDQGIGFVKSLNGSFAMAILDKRVEKICFVTDRCNSRKLFLKSTQNGFRISTSIANEFNSNTKLDPIGVACYLANGVVYNQRTLVDGIKSLERACIHWLTPSGITSERYWSYEFTNDYANADACELDDELTRLLIGAVRLRINDNESAFISLSGGYDASGILGVASQSLHLPSVRCFSYGYGGMVKGTDSDVARKMAEVDGCEWKFRESFDGDILRSLKLNAAFGEGVAHYCEDVDVWPHLSKDYGWAANSKSVLFVGDECFGDISEEHYTSTLHALTRVEIYGSTALSWLPGLFCESMSHHLFDSLDAELGCIVARYPNTDDMRDFRDFIYLDQRLSYCLFPWREYILGRFVTVRNPWMDNDILDYMCKIPSHMRRGKSHYKSVVSAMFPSLFSIGRATVTGAYPDWRREFAKSRREVEDVAMRESVLDDIVSPQAVSTLLDANDMWQTGVAKPMVRSCAERLTQIWGVRKVVRNLPGVSGHWGPLANHAALLQRILVLKLLLSGKESAW